jgi:tryptophan synthase alpha subunit
LSDIKTVFRRLNGKGALIAYVMGGDPDIRHHREGGGALVAGGADIIELGIPFSDPIADGRSIQEAAVRSLAAGTRPVDVLNLVSRIKKAHDIPVAMMTYYNILYSPGLDKLPARRSEGRRSRRDHRTRPASRRDRRVLPARHGARARHDPPRSAHHDSPRG